MSEETQDRFQRAFDVVRDCGGYVDADIAEVEDEALMGVSVEADLDADGSEILTYRHFYEEEDARGRQGMFGRIVLEEDSERVFLLDAYRFPRNEGCTYEYRPARLSAHVEGKGEYVLGFVEAALGRMMLLEEE